METLRLVDVADDGQLVLMSRDGTRYLLPVDGEVRAAVRRDRIRPADEERTDRPGPREVQARIRGGADAHEVAAATGLDLDYVRRFEGPVLAERRHVAELARSLPVHRDPGSRPASLETVVLGALADAGHDADRVTWDSRRVEGTRWDVEVFAGGGGEPAAGPVRATWRIDVATRALEEVDDAARRLTALERRRLSPVRDRVFDLEAGRSRRQQAPPVDAAASATASILEALALQRGRRPGEVREDHSPGPAGSPAAAAAPAAAPESARPDGPGPDDAEPVPAHPPARVATLAPRPVRAAGERTTVPAPDHGDDLAAGPPDGPGIEPSLLGELDLDAAEPTPRPVPRPGRTAPRTVPVPDAASRPAPPPVPSARPASPAPRPSPPSSPGSAPPQQPPSPPDEAPAGSGAARRGTKRRRAAVPSWDDIVFGARVDDE